MKKPNTEFLRSVSVIVCGVIMFICLFLGLFNEEKYSWTFVVYYICLSYLSAFMTIEGYKDKKKNGNTFFFKFGIILVVLTTISFLLVMLGII